MGVHCDTCTCQRWQIDPDSWLELPLIGGQGFCPAEFKVGVEEFTCVIVGHHSTPHDAGWKCQPCMSCGGLDQHADWCPIWDPDLYEGAQPQIGIYFSSYGPKSKATYWVDPNYGRA